MNSDQVTNFLSGYLCSLLEETRNVEAGPRYGIDRVVHQLALADDYVPVRLPFFRQNGDQLGKPKKEAEHGVDMAFVSPDGMELQIFVLKDEALTYRNWTANDFDKDLRLATAPDLQLPQVANVIRVRVILAYNKDEDAEGVRCFERFIRTNVPEKLANGVTLSCERWNLTDLTEQVKSKLLTPSLLPESFFRKFSYICSQFGDFVPGSPQWRDVLIPDWQEFLDALLEGAASERSLRMVSVALLLLREHIRKDKDGRIVAGSEAGWLDLVEWAMIRLWAAIQGSRKRTFRLLVMEIWIEFYVQRLSEYYRVNGPLLATEHSLEFPGDAVEEAGGSYRAYWHLGRIGLLSLSLWDLLPSTSKEGDSHAQQVRSLLAECSSWMIGLFNANPSCYRPVLDIQHIELFLVWRTFAQAQQWEQNETWLGALVDRLLLRRLGGGPRPLPDQRNSWEELFEELGNTDSAVSERDIPSYLLLMIMELSAMLPEGRGNSIAESIHRVLIEGKDPSGKSFEFKQKVELVGWIPPSDWPSRALRAGVYDGYGVSVTLSKDNVISSLVDYVKATNSAVEIDYEGSKPVPVAAFLLACLKHSAPLPSFVWRQRATTKNARGKK